MTKEEERVKTARLEGELERKRTENSLLRQMLEERLKRLNEVEGNWRRIATIAASRHRVMDWDASGSAHAGKVRRRWGAKRALGHTLKLVETPDEVVRHRLKVRLRGQHPLAKEPRE